MQLTAIDAAVPARRHGPENLPRALERVGAATALVQGDAHAVGGAVGGVEVARGEAETGAVDGVEGGEDEEVEFGGEGGEGGCGGGGSFGGSGGGVSNSWAGDENWGMRQVDGGAVVGACSGIDGASWVEGEGGGVNSGSVHRVGGGEDLGGGHFYICALLSLGGRWGGTAAMTVRNGTIFWGWRGVLS